MARSGFRGRGRPGSETERTNGTVRRRGRVAPLAAPFAIACLLSPSSIAGHDFNGAGVAFTEGDVYLLGIASHLQGAPGEAVVALQIFVPELAPEGEVEIRIVESASFTARTNFLDASLEKETVVVQTDYFAESMTPGIDFRLDGVRVAQTVTAEGHFQSYAIRIGPGA